MNYFDFFGLAVDLFLDEKRLKEKYYLASKKYHPDINQSADPMAYMQLLEQSGHVNTGYKVLNDFNLRLKHILELHNMLTNPNEQLPPDFLMEMMDLNEVVMEASMDPSSKEKAEAMITARDEKLRAELRVIWDKATPEDLQQTELESLKEIYYKQKYLLRIRKNLNNFAEL